MKNTGKGSSILKDVTGLIISWPHTVPVHIHLYDLAHAPHKISVW